MVDKERIQKEKTAVHFFVIKSGLRNVVSLMEVAYYGGMILSQRSHQKLVVVFDTEEDISQMPKDEQDTIKIAWKQVQDLLEDQGIEVFKNISDGLKKIVSLLSEDKTKDPQGLAAGEKIPQTKTSIRNEIIHFLASPAFYNIDNISQVLHSTAIKDSDLFYHRSIMPMNIWSQDNPSVLLVFIDSRSPQLGSLIKASYDIGLGQTKTVLCVQPLGEDLQVSHGLTSQALKDYNRYGHYKAIFSLNFVEFDIFRSERESGSYVNRSPIF